jgi:hypothetical protein
MQERKEIIANTFLNILSPLHWHYRQHEMKNYSKQLSQYWPTILKAWSEYREKHPIIECDLSEKTVAALPAADYINYLSERDREKTRQIYEAITAKGGVMVFIRDNKNQILQSYTFDAAELNDQKDFI